MRVAILLFVLLLSGCATSGTGSTAPSAWRLADLIDTPGDTITLKRSNGIAATVLSRSKLEQLHAAQEKIQLAASVVADVLIIDLPSGEPNAFAWEDGAWRYVGVSTAMLDLMAHDQDQYAALFGHEVAHLVKDHVADSQARQEALGVVKIVAVIALAVAGAPSSTGSVVDLGAAVIDTSFSREQEREADTLSVKYMAKAGFDPAGAIRLQRSLLAAAGSSPLPFLSSHPSSEERIKSLQAIIDQSDYVQRATPDAANAAADTTGGDGVGPAPDLPDRAVAVDGVNALLGGVAFRQTGDQIVVAGIASNSRTTLLVGDQVVRCALGAEGRSAVKALRDLAKCSMGTAEPPTYVFIVLREGVEDTKSVALSRRSQ